MPNERCQEKCREAYDDKGASGGLGLLESEREQRPSGAEQQAAAGRRASQPHPLSGEERPWEFTLSQLRPEAGSRRYSEGTRDTPSNTCTELTSQSRTWRHGEKPHKVEQKCADIEQ